MSHTQKTNINIFQNLIRFSLTRRNNTAVHTKTYTSQFALRMCGLVLRNNSSRDQIRRKHTHYIPLGPGAVLILFLFCQFSR